MCQWTGCKVFPLFLAFFVGMTAVSVVHAGSRPDSVWIPLISRLTLDGFDRFELERLFSSPALEYDSGLMFRKMDALLGSRKAVNKGAKPAPPKVNTDYLNPMLMAGAYAYMREHRETLSDIEDEYGVPREVLVALVLVETKLGVKIGDRPAVSPLASMALGGDPGQFKEFLASRKVSGEDSRWLAKRIARKADWAYNELKALLTYARNNGRQDPLVIPGSMYGAIGFCQFMPTSALHYGVDGDGDGRLDLFSKRDALFSMANFLKKHGWKEEMTEERRLAVLYRYNHSKSYSLTVLAVAEKLRVIAETVG